MPRLQFTIVAIYGVGLYNCSRTRDFIYIEHRSEILMTSHLNDFFCENLISSHHHMTQFLRKLLFVNSDYSTLSVLIVFDKVCAINRVVCMVRLT